MKNILLTGRPGIGKTTLINESVHKIREAGIQIGGGSLPEKSDQGTLVKAS